MPQIIFVAGVVCIHRRGMQFALLATTQIVQPQFWQQQISSKSNQRFEE